MNNYDQWKLESGIEEKDNDCQYCGEPCETEFCDKDCKKGYEYDMFND